MSAVQSLGVAIFTLSVSLLVGGCSVSTSPVPVESSMTGVPEAPAELTRVCTLSDSRLTEVSGMTASVQHPGILWMHNDSGDTGRIFAVDASTCAVRSVIEVSGFDPVDMEAIALGKDDDDRWVLWLGDIGDNLDAHASVTLAKIAEPPDLQDATLPAQLKRVEYADGPRDAEALLVEPKAGGRMWIVTKSRGNTGGYYRVPIESGDTTVTAQRVAPGPTLVTDGAVAPDGRSYVLRTYLDGKLFPGTPPVADGTSLQIGFQGQSEAITFSANSAFLYVTSEGVDQPLLAAPLPN